MQHLILLHGALGHSSHFDTLLPFLSKHFHMHTLLFHGHGSTAIPDQGLSIELYISQLEDYVAQQQIPRAHLFGYSMGGYVALCYARQHPEQVQSVLTLATKLDWNPETVQKEVRMLQPEKIREKVPAYAAQLENLHGAGWTLLLPAIATLMTRLAAQPLLDDAAYQAIRVPVRMMVGDRDAMVSIDETRRALQQLPEATFAVLPATPHPIDKVRPNLLIDLMKDFWLL